MSMMYSVFSSSVSFSYSCGGRSLVYLGMGAPLPNCNGVHALCLVGLRATLVVRALQRQTACEERYCSAECDGSAECDWSPVRWRMGSPRWFLSSSRYSCF